MIALTINILTINKNIYILCNILHNCVLVILFKLQHQAMTNLLNVLNGLTPPPYTHTNTQAQTSTHKHTQTHTHTHKRAYTLTVPVERACRHDTCQER